MAKEFSYQFYRTDAWLKCRDAVLRRDRYLCVECLKRGILTPAWTVHHIVHLTPDNINDPNVTLDPKNLESVCIQCHADIHAEDKARGLDRVNAAKHSARRTRYKVAENGDVVV